MFVRPEAEVVLFAEELFTSSSSSKVETDENGDIVIKDPEGEL